MQRLVFAYTVQDGDEDNDGIQVRGPTLRNARSITDYNGTTADGSWTYRERGHDVGDSGPPSATAGSITSRPMLGGRYQPGEVIEMTLTADEALIVDASATINLPTSVGDRYVLMDYDRQRSACVDANLLGFTWIVKPGFQDVDGISVHHWNLHLGARDQPRLTDWSGHALRVQSPAAYLAGREHRVGGLGPPVVTGVEITSTPESGNAYTSWETMEVTLTVSEPVTVRVDRNSDCGLAMTIYGTRSSGSTGP